MKVVYCLYFLHHSDAFDLQYGVGILRVSEGFDLHKVTDDLLAVIDEDFNMNDTDEGIIKSRQLNNFHFKRTESVKGNGQVMGKYGYWSCW